MDLVVLGSGTAVPRPGRAPAGLYVEEAGVRLLLDAGPGSLSRLADAGGRLEDLDGVAITHLHPDHSADLLAVLFGLKNPDLVRERPLTVLGPPGLHGLVEGFVAAYGRWVEDPPCGVQLREWQASQELAGWRLDTLPVEHGGAAHGLRLTTPAGLVLCYPGDTDECDAVVELARGADLLVLDCSHPHRRKVEGHLSPTPCGRLAARAGVAALLLTHIYPGWDPETARPRVARHWDGPLHLAADGLRLTV